MRENRIESVLKKRVEDLGGLCIKLDPMFKKGIPDRLIILPGGRIYFTELKTDSGKVSKLQSVRIQKLNDMGFEVRCIKGMNEVKDFIDEIMELSETGSESHS